MNASLSQTQFSEAGDPLERRLVISHTLAPRSPAHSVSWFPLLVLPTFSVALGQELPTWGFMWAMLFAVVAGCKWLTWRLSIIGQPRPVMWRSLAYFVAWPGMNAETFLKPVAKLLRPSLTLWTQAMGKMLFGTLLLCSLARFVPAHRPLVAGWIGMIGLAFVLHFGIFHVLALLWQSAGIDAPHIFRSPMLARSVGDLWGSRWNLAFRDLAHTFVFRPLVGRGGVFGASLATFVVSGLVHELVISLPAGAGYGLPTAYFLIQWFGLVVERSWIGRRLGLRHGFIGWLFAFVVVVGPMCILFHPPFVTGVIVPFLRVIGAF